MIQNQHRHGDVLLHPLDADGQPLDLTPPADAKHVERLTLALGEATGTAHVVTGDVITWDAGGQRYVRVGPKGATLVQERYGVVLDAPDGHAAQVLAPGADLVYIPQKEGTLDDEWAPVVD